MLGESCSIHAGCLLGQEEPSSEYRGGLSFYNFEA